MALVGVQIPEHARALSALASNYYEVDLGNQIGAKYARIMALPASRSDNAGRVARVLDACARHAMGEPGRTKVAVDVGGGTGVFLAKLLSVAGGGWRGVAVEPDPLAVAHLRSLGLFDVRASRFHASLDLPEADLLTLNKVIEHVEDPLPMLTLAARGLAPYGLAYVEVPDALTAVHRPPEDNILGALHRHLYEPGTLAQLLQRAGLVVLEVRRIVEPSGKLTVYAFAARGDTYQDRARAP